MTSKIRRICLYSGPGSGKSTTAAHIFYKLKTERISGCSSLNVELVNEYVKMWAYEKRHPIGFAQLYLFAKQLRKEEVPLLNGVDVIVSDSPLLLNTSYAEKHNAPGHQNLVALAEEFETSYPGLHIFLDRGNRRYIHHGRYQNEDEAREMDEHIKNSLRKHLPNKFVEFSSDNTDGIYQHILDNLGNKMITAKDAIALSDEGRHSLKDALEWISSRIRDQAEEGFRTAHLGPCYVFEHLIERIEYELTKSGFNVMWDPNTRVLIVCWREEDIEYVEAKKKIKTEEAKSLGNMLELAILKEEKKLLKENNNAPSENPF